MREINLAKYSLKARKTFQNILTCARDEFASKGYNNTSISSISKAANVSVGCIYKYFKNKDELYSYIIQNEQTIIRDMLRNAIKNCKTREEREKAGLKAWLYHVKNYPGIYKLIWETLFIDMNEFAKYYDRFSKGYINALNKDSDQLTNDDYSTISYILIGISNFLGIRILIEKSTEEEIDSMVDSALKLLKNGFLK